MAHSSIVAWRIPWTEEPNGLQSIRLQRVGTQLRWLSMHARMEINTKRMSKESRNDLPLGTSLVVQWLWLWAPNAGGLSFIPYQGTKYHTLQLRILMLPPHPQKSILHGAMKILQAATKTQSSQINKERIDLLLLGWPVIQIHPRLSQF